ncbi:MAG: anthranilate phosphoribosyltransferase [Saprospiraceae bacterium]|nr:anthranilate phosphoribosyltransferase [Saprospiraceae bacterium]MCB9322205.1 anthranilate phosphoribosyltransferase [Lewinellaceae bacterium]
MKNILNKLFDHSILSREEAKDILLQISRGEHHEVHIASFITVYQMRPITVAELQGFSDALLELCVPFDVKGMETFDIVGTGGDSKNTFNISTTSAFVIAGAGYKVTKHGSYGVSSNVGSSNVLEEMGYQFTNEQDTLMRQLEEANICFLHAPLFHPAMKEVVPVRRQLGMKTFFNMLGPLVNPVSPKWQLFGTYNLELSRLYQYLMQETERHFSIVYALDGYDEISLTGPFKWRSRNSEQLLYPKDLGMPTYTEKDLYGGETADEARGIMTNVLKNEATVAQKDVVIANAGFSIHTIKPETSLPDCMAEARESIESGKALQTLKKLLK